MTIYKTKNSYNFFEYLIAVAIILGTRSIFLHSDLNSGNKLTILFLFILAIGILGCTCISGINVKLISNNRYFIVFPFFVIVYLFIRPVSLFEDFYYSISCLLIFFFYINSNQNNYSILFKYKNIVFIIAVTSVIMWALAFKFNVIQPTSSFYSDWNKNYVKSYYFIFYATQAQRNTAIFTEAPMSSLHFSMALLIELFLNHKKHLWKAVVLAFAIYTTGATTGYLLVILLAFSLFLVYRPKKRLIKELKIIFIFLAAIVVTIMAVYLIKLKLSTSSGSRRLEDLINCFNAWGTSPIFGIGGGDVADDLLSGSSNSIGRLLAERGLWIGSLYLFCFGRFIYTNWTDKSKIIFFILFLYLFMITVMQYTHLMFVLLAFFLNERSHSSAMKNKYVKVNPHIAG